MSRPKSTRVSKPSLKARAASETSTPVKSVKRSKRAPKTPPKTPAKRPVEPAASEKRGCTGCKEVHPGHFFLALSPKSLHDMTEKCFKCRRVDAVSDFLKTHAEGGALTLTAQKDHLDSQEAMCAKWKRTLQNRGFEVTVAQIDAVMSKVKTHPALRDAVKTMPTEETTTDDDAETVIDDSIPIKQSGSERASIVNSSPRGLILSDELSPTAQKMLAGVSALREAADILEIACHLPSHDLETVINNTFETAADLTCAEDFANELMERLITSMRLARSVTAADIEAAKILLSMSTA